MRFSGQQTSAVRTSRPSPIRSRMATTRHQHRHRSVNPALKEQFTSFVQALNDAR
jgi:hypothetical protein